METGIIFDIQRYCTDDGPGIRTAVFLKGCPLRCPWCANPESQRQSAEILWDARRCTGCHRCAEACPNGAWDRAANGAPLLDRHACGGCLACAAACPSNAITAVGRRYTVDEVAAICARDRAFYEESGGGVTLSGGEALMQPAFATELLHRLKALGIHTAVETAGFVPERAFRDALPAIDLLLFDIKHPQESPHRQATGVSLQPILSNLACALSQGKAVCVRIPVIPGFNDSDACQTAFADLLASMEVQSVQLLPFHQLGEAKHAMLGRAYSFGGVPSLDHGALGPFSALLRGRGFRCIGA